MNQAAEKYPGAAVAITGIGLNTPLGQCTVQTYTSVRAGLNRFSAWSIAGGDQGGDDGAAIVSTIEGKPKGTWGEQAANLTTEALQEALFDAGLYEPQNLHEVFGRSAISAHLALPYEDRIDIDKESWAAFIENAKSHCVVALHSNDVNILPYGHAAGLMAIDQALGKLRLGQSDVCVVIGVDSLLADEYLQWLVSEDKLKTDFQPSGLIPAEGAAVLILEREADAIKREASIYAVLTAVGTAEEEIPFDGPTPTRSEGLSAAMNFVLKGSGHDLDSFGDVLTDINGERGRFQEWGLVEVRCLHVLKDGWNLFHTADCIGDLGAATGIFLVGFGAGLLHWGHAQRDGLLVSTASERGQRACASLFASTNEEGME